LAVFVQFILKSINIFLKKLFITLVLITSTRCTQIELVHITVLSSSIEH